MSNDSTSNSNLLFAVVLSVLFMIMWNHFFPPAGREISEKNDGSSGKTAVEADFLHPSDVTPKQNVALPFYFSNDALIGAMNLRGLRFYDLVLKQYYDNNGSHIKLLGEEDTPSFIEFRWLSRDPHITMPNTSTIWAAEGDIESGITFSWRNPEKVTFKLRLEMDDKYMFTIHPEVVNNSKTEFDITFYTIVSKRIDLKQGNMVAHVGGVSMFNNKLHEYSYTDIADGDVKGKQSNVDWFGFSDKYWLIAIAPPEAAIVKFAQEKTDQKVKSHFATLDTIAPNKATSLKTFKMFTGAKELEILDQYEEGYNLKMFDKAIDFGMLYFITRPMSIFLTSIYHFVGNFGWAIILMTIFIKILLFPLALKGFRSMNKMTKLNPKIRKLKETHKNDQQALQKAIVELYRKQGVNPLAGCLPIFIQFPIFFALYKVLCINIEMRQAEFIWWIKDLSAPDPLNIFNLCGLIPIELPSVLHIGIWPCLMSLSMFFYQKCTPAPTDPTQAKVMKFMPLIMLILFNSFPSGLVIYWTVSNLLTIMQQVSIRYIDGKSEAAKKG